MTSQTVRRGAPLAAGVAVLAVLVGGAYLLRDGGAAPGAAAPPPLRIGAFVASADLATGEGHITVSGTLPDGPDSAPVHRFTDADPDVAVRIASALGVDPGQVHVGEGPGAPWQFARQGADLCLPPLPGAGPEGAVSSSCAVPPDQRPAPTDPPSADEVAAAARPVLEAVGLDLPADVPTAEDVGLSTRTVLVDPVVGDVPTAGVSTSVTVDGRGVLSATGWLAGTRSGDSYPVITATEAVDRLAAMPVPLIGCPESTVPAPPGPVCGGPREVTGATFGLSLQWEGERPMLVPSWLLDVVGSTSPIGVVAVDSSYLQPPDSAGVPGDPGSSDPGTPVEPVAPDVEPTPLTSRFDSVAPVDDGAGLVVTFYGGVDTCYEYEVTAEESPDEVALALVEDRTGEVCIDLAQQYELAVELERPLGDRRVVDADTGLPLYPARAEG